ncbi:MAG TPA: AAA family ATPase, partial [Candidatus Acidoferrales bacterium]|nr:AAA family ATPase [Candidatus Acidoferrales bacterium]
MRNTSSVQVPEELSPEIGALLEKLLDVGPEAPPIEEKLQMLQLLRLQTRDRTQRVDRWLLERLHECVSGTVDLRDQGRALKELVDSLVAEPLYPVVVHGVSGGSERRALVVVGGTPRLVRVSKDLDNELLTPGDQVCLSRELNAVVEKLSAGSPRYGETATFDRFIDDGRVAIKWRDEELVVLAAGELRDQDLRQGDTIRYDRSGWCAFERLAVADGTRFLASEVPDIGRDRLGGMDSVLDDLVAALSVTLLDADKASRYALDSRAAILMHGAPGNGKTMMARIAASEISRLSGRRCHFSVVKPAEWEAAYVGETERAIRSCFAAAARAAAASDGFTVLFLDEVESIGRVRGASVGQHHDRFLAALLAELDGFAERGRIAVIAATNRRDLLDPALLQRLSDVEIAVGRPDMRSARAIFEVHLPETLPYHPNGTAALKTRAALIDVGVGRLYAPNADNALCVLKFRDNRTRRVTARELASGRIVAQICRSACRAAFLRDHRGGSPGVQIDDMHEAVSDALDRLSGLLTVRNAHAYL